MRATKCYLHFIPKFHNSSTFTESPCLLTKKSSRCLLTKKSFTDLLKCCKSMPRLKQIQAQLFMHGLHHNIDVLHKLIVFAAEKNLFHAEKILADQNERPTLFIYNVVVKALAKSSNCRDALLLFDELRVRGLYPDSSTYPSVFKAVGNLRVVLEGEKTHGFVLKSGVLYDSQVCNSVLDMYGELGWVESMSKVFDEMPYRD